MSDAALQPRPLSEKQRLMGALRTAYEGDQPFVPTDAMYRLAELHTEEIQQLQGELAQVELALQHAKARVGFYTAMAEGQDRLDRQIEEGDTTQARERGGDVNEDDIQAVLAGQALAGQAVAWVRFLNRTLNNTRGEHDADIINLTRGTVERLRDDLAAVARHLDGGAS